MFLCANPSISQDGRYVAFGSNAPNLVPGDTNGSFDVFVHDNHTGQTTRVSVDNGGGQGNGISVTPALNGDGTLVVFESFAANFIAGDTNGSGDVFIYDQGTGQTARVSVDSTGAEAIGGDSRFPRISADGRFVVFDSAATNLVPGDTNGLVDIFVHDRVTGQTSRVSVDSAGMQATGGHSLIPAISADGRFVAFESGAVNLVPGDTNGVGDVFVHDRQTGQTLRVSIDSTGAQATGGSSRAAISADGRYVAFVSEATDLVEDDTNVIGDIFIHDLQKGQTIRLSVDNNGMQASGGIGSENPAINGDGRFVAFSSDASNLVPADTNGASDIFVAAKE